MEQNLINDGMSLSEKYTIILENDALTGMYNRNGFYLHTKELLDSNPDTEYDICCINIDKFKVVNDLFGTFSGDKLLIFLATKLHEYIGDSGTIARLTADNFCVCIPHTDIVYEDLARSVMKWLESYPLALRLVARCGFYYVHDREVPISIMCDRANMAIMEIKGNYEKTFSIYDDKIRKRLLQEQEIINEMKRALDEHQFVVYYQPKVNMESEKFIGSEALVRWIHPEKGIISPGIFIPIFERNGFISELDRYVWECVCQDIRRWMQEGFAVCPVSINVSRAELYNKSLALVLSSMIDKYDVPINMLQLEITESAYTENPDQLIEIVQELKSIGFTILMDDFGSGYSSLNTLKDVPVDVLKLDLKFLYNMDHNLKANYILKSVVQMAKRLDLLVIAEGVETETQADFLKSIGCVRAQGYLYAKPMPRKDLEIYLSDPDKISMADDESRDGLVNIDDLMNGYHREDEIEWYRQAMSKLDATMYEYDVENDLMTLFDMRTEEESDELKKVEILNFGKCLGERKILYKEDAQKVKEMFAAGSIGKLEVRMRDLGTSRGYRWYRQNGKMNYTKDGRIKSVVGVLQDITEEKIEDLIHNILTHFEKTDVDEIVDDVLKEIAFEVVADRVSFTLTRCEKASDTGIRTYDRTKGFTSIKSVEYVNELSEALRETGLKKDSRTTLCAADKGKYPDFIIKHLFSNEEQLVILSRFSVLESYEIVLSVAFCEHPKTLPERDMKHLAEVTKCLTSSYANLFSMMREQERTELYTAAYTMSDLRLWEWNIQTHTMLRSKNVVDRDNLPERVENVPEAAIEMGLIHPDFIEDYRKVFKSLSEGVDSTVMVLALYPDGCYHWLRIEFSVIFDRNGRPLKAIGFGENVDAVYESQRIAREKVLVKKNNSSESYWYKADLTRNVATDWSSKLKKMQPDTCYQQMIDIMADRVVCPECREEFLAKMSVKSLLSQFAEGVQTTSTHFKYINHETGESHFRGVNIDMHMDEDGHVQLFGYLRNIDEKIGYERYAVGGAVRNPDYRIYTKETFEQIVKGIISEENRRDGVLMLVDMDRFELINEKFGKRYATGIIKNVIAILKAIIPPYAFAGEMLLDRIAIYIPHYDHMREVFKEFNAIQKSLHTNFFVGPQSYVLSASIGMVYAESCDWDYDRMYAEAEADMLEVKKIGS